MSLTQQEAIQMKTDVEILKVSTSQVLQAIGESVSAQKENSNLINELMIEMKERDVRDEYHTRDMKELKGHVERVEKEFKLYTDINREPLEKLTQSQNIKETFYKSITSTWGKIFAMLLLVGVAYTLGIDLSKIVK